jgi:hypothetical protein
MVQFFSIIAIYKVEDIRKISSICDVKLSQKPKWRYHIHPFRGHLSSKKDLSLRSFLASSFL